MTTVVLTGGTVVDGTGAAAVVADVAIEAGMITSIGPPGSLSLEQAQVIDCTGLVVAPGFIDIHTHSDLTRLRYPDAATRVLQGITTEVTGNCGMSPFPVPSTVADLRAIIGPLDVCPEVSISWQGVESYLDHLDAAGGATNIAPLVGHGSLRLAALGNQPTTDQGIQAMVEELGRALDAGIWGLSFGLMYAPGELAAQEELVALAAEVGRRDGIVSVHLRSYGAATLHEAVRELLDVAGQAEARLQISHLRSIHDQDAAGMHRALDVLRASEVDVQADAYPYLAGHTTLLQLFPPDVRGAGPDAVLDFARQQRQVAVDYLRDRVQDPAGVVIAKTTDAALQTKSIEQAAAEASVPWPEFMVDLLVDSRAETDVIVFGSTVEDTHLSLSDPLVSIASDGVALDLDHSANLPHPRSIGTFPRAIRELVDGGLPLELAVRKATGQPASRLGLADRGLIKVGLAADIVVFDPDTLRDNATYAEPLVPPSGIETVMVNGEMVVRAGAVTGARPGRLLRKADARRTA